MTNPWIEIEEVQHRDVLMIPGSSEYTWQAQFACQVQILPHLEWNKLKWGFNAQALYDESIERQRVFIESQYGAQPRSGMEYPDYRTLVLRFISYPGEGLSVVVLGKIHAKTKACAAESALCYCSEVISTFPYDYTLIPAQTRQDFFQISGMNILDESIGQLDMAQIKRSEVPLFPELNTPFLHGLWRSGARAHEQIWRSLAASSSPLILNILLRSTVLYEKERERLLESVETVESRHGPKVNPKTLSSLQKWNSMYVDRRLVAWEKFFYLQIHLASPEKLNENLFRTVGTSLAFNSGGEPLPGYQVVLPGTDAKSWQGRLKTLDPIFARSYLPIERLSDIADMQEVLAVVRLPYSPPENGFPDVNYMMNRAP